MPSSCLVRSAGRPRAGAIPAVQSRCAAGRYRHETVCCPLFTCAVGCCDCHAGSAQDTPPPVKGMFPAHRLSCRHSAARHHHDRQSAAAQLCTAAGALRACGEQRACRLDGHALLGGGQPAGAAMVATNDLDHAAIAAGRAGKCRDGHAGPHRLRQESVDRAEPSGPGHIGQGPARQACGRAGAAIAARHLQVARISSTSSRSRTTAAAIS